MNLYEQAEKLDQAMASIDSWIAEHQEALAANGGVLPAEVTAEYDTLMKEQKDSIVWSGKKIQEYDADIDVIDQEIARLKRRRDGIARKQAWRERMLFEYLQREGIDQIKNPLITVSIKLNPPKVLFPLWSQTELGAFWANPKYDWCVQRKDPEYRLDLLAIKEEWRGRGGEQVVARPIPEGITVVQDKALSLR